MIDEPKESPQWRQQHSVEVIDGVAVIDGVPDPSVAIIDGMPLVGWSSPKGREIEENRREHLRNLIRAGIFPAYPDQVASLGLRPDEHPPLSWYHPPNGMLTSNNCWPPEYDWDMERAKRLARIGPGWRRDWDKDMAEDRANEAAQTKPIADGPA